MECKETTSIGADVREWHKQFNPKSNLWEVIVWVSGIEETHAFFRTEQAADSWTERARG
jgi:hypothetical protein